MHQDLDFVQAVAHYVTSGGYYILAFICFALRAAGAQGIEWLTQKLHQYPNVLAWFGTFILACALDHSVGAFLAPSVAVVMLAWSETTVTWATVGYCLMGLRPEKKVGP